MNHKKYFLIFYCQIILVLSAFSQELPPISNYGISDYQAGNQNWSIAQSENNYIYIGNNQGLLEFDGARWTLYPSPNGTIVRAVQVIGDRIYTGCYMELGYWSRNNLGLLEYNSLLDQLKEPLVEDEHFWNITSHDEWVLFQSTNRIYLYDTINESFKIIDFDVQRTKIFNLGSEIFVQKNTGGLYLIQNGKTVLESEDPVFLDNFVVGIYDHAGRKVIITEDGKFYFYDQGRLSPWEVDLDEEGALYIYSSLRLNDGSFILGTISNGYIHLDKSGKIVQKVDQERGLLNNTVLSLFQDAEDNLWLGLDNGISNINLESAFRVYTDTKGKLGVVYASMVFEDILYLGTNQGLFFKPMNSTGEFNFVQGTKGQVWNLKVIDNTLFCTHTQGTFVVKDKKATLVYNKTGTWEVESIKGNDRLLIQGNYNGLSILEKTDGKWKFRNKIQGFENSSRSMVLTNDSEVTVNHEYKGLFHLVLDETYEKVINSTFIDPKGYDSSVLKYDDKIIYTSNEGAFDVNTQKAELSVDSLWTNAFYAKGDAIKGRLVVEATNKNAWGFSERNIIFMSSDNFDGTPRVQRVAIPSFFRKNQGITGYENISYLYGSTYLIGTSNGYVLLDLNKLRDADYSIKINAISKEMPHKGDELISLTDNLSLPFNQNTLKFSFSVPEFDKYKEVDFQYQLKGEFDTWSDWFKEPFLNFNKLPYGSYILVVRARIGNKISSNVASYAFVIQKPWYLSASAIVFYTIGFFTLMGVIHTSYRRHYRKQRNRLIEENKRAIEHSQLESEQEIMRLKNEQLKFDIESKNRELATTAMSLINKNELLSSIKNDLIQTERDISKEEVVKIIDRGLSDNKDWEFFKEAFNNADKNFMDKIKKLHPDLTANDLKFCSYLRLNLTSKEIAPLLNISIRSVEIKRYRLRKKLNLLHEMNLVDYILSI